MTPTPRRSRTIRLLAPVICVAALTGMTACGDEADDDGGPAATSGDSTAATDDAAGITVTGAWARTSAMNQTNGAAYFVITGGAEDDTLIGALAPTEVAATTEMHETVMAETDDTTAMSDDTMAMSDDTMAMGDGSMTMQPVESVMVPAGGTVAFEPGGYHIMLIDLVAPLETGATFDLELTFEKAGTVTVPVEVREN